jgi:hypothetical protein
MLPKRSDIIRVDVDIEAVPVRSSMYGSFHSIGEEKVKILTGSKMRYLRTRGDKVYGQILNPPKVNKFLRQVADINTRQTYEIDAYSVSFFCSKDNFKPEDLNEVKEDSVAQGPTQLGSLT